MEALKMRKAHSSFREDNDDDVEAINIHERGHHQEPSPATGGAMMSAGEISSEVAPLPAEFRYIPRVFRFDKPGEPIEATGLAISTFGSGPVVMASMFLGPALLKLATEAAGCSAEEQDACENKVYGFRPSSLLSNLAIASGLLGAITMPVFGAIVDHTPYRRQVGLVSVIAVTVLKGVEVMVGQHTWFLVTLLQVITSVFYNIYVTASYAYRSELSHNADELSHYNTSYNVIQFVSMLFFLVEVLVLASLFGTGDVGTARISQTIASTTAGVFFLTSWTRLFRDRPATSQPLQGRSLLASGFTKVFDTSKKIHRQYKPFQWAIVAVALHEAAANAIASIATTYVTEVLHMDATEIGLVFLIVLIMGIPGSKLGNWVSLRLHSSVMSAAICDIAFIIINTCASLVLTGPEQKHLTYFFSALWGITIGWLSPVDTTLFMTLMPKDSRAEMMGIYTLVVQSLSWAPPMVFTALNEAGLNMAYGLASLNLFFLAGLFFLRLVGDQHRKGGRNVDDGQLYERAEIEMSKDEDPARGELL